MWRSSRFTRISALTNGKIIAAGICRGELNFWQNPETFLLLSIWSSVGKWFIAGADASKGDLVVTSGCYHLRLKPGKEALLAYIVYGFSTEMFRVQMRALATGSDGLSVISEEDFGEIVLPRISDKKFRTTLDAQITGWTKSGVPLARLVDGHLKTNYPSLDVPSRSSHVAQV